MLDVDAVRAVTRLIDKGFEAYLVGGCVRDLLLDRTPKDYDIATEARPPQVKRTFPRNCRIIGRRFKLAHLHFHGNTKILECSTFRRTPQEKPEGDGDDADLLITRDNEFGTAEEDALRRDFTVNALFLDPTRDLIVDHCNGLEDIEARVIRTIGDPVVRFREDPVRILRAAKFAGRLGFTVEKKTLAAMGETAEDLVRAAPPRVLEEILRLLRSGHARQSFELLRDVGAIQHLVPVVGKFLNHASDEQTDSFWQLLEVLDEHVQAQPPGREPPPNGVLLAVLMFGAVERERAEQPTRSASSVAENLLGSLAVDLRLPRRDSGCLKRICGVQHRFEQSEGKRRYRTESFLTSPYFDEALQLFALRAQASGMDPAIVDQWYDLVGGRPAVEEAEAIEERPRKKRRRRRRRRSEDDEESAPNQARADDTPTEDADEPAAAAPEEDAEAAPPKPRKARKKATRKKATTKKAAAEEDLSDVTFPVSDEPSPHGDPLNPFAAVTDRPPTPEDPASEYPPSEYPASEDPAPEDRASDDDAGDDAFPLDRGHEEEDNYEADAAPRRKRRRRRRKSRDDDDDADRATEVDADADESEDHDATVTARDNDRDDNREDGQEGDDSDDRPKRRRRGRRGRGRSRNADDRDTNERTGTAEEGDGDEPQAKKSRRGGRDDDRDGRPNKVKSKKPANDRQRDTKKRGQRGDSRRDKKRGKKGKSGGNRDVDVVPRYRDRRGKVEVIEPASLDLSAFDVELDPKRVPTFGSIVEGKGKPKRRGPRPPEGEGDSYRPPPPPGGQDRPDSPPPPPADSPDTFGDW